ncbi:hypothetical protein F4818DRAFT_430331 [Hypoxylon cercidicola]|nr:hypothetical protein F4818DRAFT_430331 [Hypoxylon cercidicola]
MKRTKEEEQRKRVLESHRSRVEEVQAAYDALEAELKKNDGKGSPINFFTDCMWGLVGEMFGPGKSIDVGHVRSKSYDLYSVDYLENCYQEDYYDYWTRADFEEEDESEVETRTKSRSKRHRI